MLHDKGPYYYLRSPLTVCIPPRKAMHLSIVGGLWEQCIARVHMHIRSRLVNLLNSLRMHEGDLPF